MRTAPAILVIGVLVLVWQGYRLRHRATDLGSWAITIALFAILGSVALRILADPGGPLATVNPVVRILFVNVAIALAALALHLFRLHVAGASTTSARARVAIATATAVVIIMTALALSLVSTGTALNYSDATLRQPIAAAFYVVSGSYFSYVLCSASMWAITSALEAAGHVRLSLALVGLGTLLVGAYCVVNAMFVTIVFLGGPHYTVPAAVATVSNTIAAPAIVIGLMLPFFVGRLRALGTWWWQLRAYRALKPLWHAANSLHPEYALASVGQRSDPGQGQERRAPAKGLAYRFRRRRAECYDALAKIRGQLARGVEVPGPSHMLIEVLQQRPELLDIEFDGKAANAAYRADTVKLVEISKQLARVSSRQR